MKPLKFVTAQELDPLTAQFLNVRFVAFLNAFCERQSMDFARAYHLASAILPDADIPQD